MKRDNKTILKAIRIATTIGLFYGGLGAVVMGGLFAIVCPLITSLLTLFSTDFMGLPYIGVYSIIFGLIGNLVGYFLTKPYIKHDLEALRDIMFPVVAFTGYLFMAIFMGLALLIQL